MAGGGRGRRNVRNQRFRTARRREKSKSYSIGTEKPQSSQALTTGIWLSIACGAEQYGLSPTDLKQFRLTAAACSGVDGHQVLVPSRPLRVAWDNSITLPSKHTPAFSLGGTVSWTRTGNWYAKCRWRRVHGHTNLTNGNRLLEIGGSTGSTSTNILDEKHQCTKDVEWTLEQRWTSARSGLVWFSQTTRVGCEKRFAWKRRTHEGCGGWWRNTTKQSLSSRAAFRDGPI